MATPRICSIPDCGKRHSAHGWCQAHYDRWRHHGDPIAGGASWGEPENYLHDVVLAYDGNECLTWPFAKHKGYGVMRQEGKTRRVPRLVCEHANGPPPSPRHEAAHSCGNGHLACVAKRHLSWKTPAANQADKLKHGTTNRGERCGTSKLTEPEVRQIRALKGIKPQREIATRFSVSQQTVWRIHTNARWGWLI